MNFQNAAKTGFRRAFDFKGRSSRSEFWYWVLFSLILSFTTSFVDQLIFGSSFAAVGPLGLILALILFIPNISITFRRLHDINKSAWWLLILCIPFIGIIMFIVWHCSKGTKGPNRFGPDPLMLDAVDVTFIDNTL